MVVIVLVELGVELRCRVSAQPGADGQGSGKYQVKHRHFHHALVEIRRPVLDNLDRYNLLRLQVLALDNLTEGALSEDIENQIPVPMR